MPQTVLLRVDVSPAFGKYIRGRGSKVRSSIRAHSPIRAILYVKK